MPAAAVYPDQQRRRWSIAIGASGRVGEIELAPQPWLEPDFFVKYWGDGDEAALAAQEVFARERDIILRESG